MSRAYEVQATFFIIADDAGEAQAITQDFLEVALVGLLPRACTDADMNIRGFGIDSTKESR